MWNGKPVILHAYMGVYQSLTLMISFATLIVLILSFHKRK
ncbi:putative holin-like toxin [Desulfosporosinus sp.]